MILVTSINGKEYYLNCDLIYKVEESFDTIITLIEGKKIRVKDTPEEVVEKVIAYKKLIHSGIQGRDNI